MTKIQTELNTKTVTDTKTLTKTKTDNAHKTKPVLVTDNKPIPLNDIKPPDVIKPPKIPPPDVVPPPDEIKPPKPPKPPGDEPPPPDDKKKWIKLPGSDKPKDKPIHTAEDRANAVTWKQGIGYWIVYPDKSTEWSKNKPEGVKEVPGPDKNKPKATIQVYQPSKRGKVTTFDADMGIQDVKVRKQGKRILDISFKQDRGQKTTNPVRLGFKSEKRGKIYHTRISNGEVISRRPL